MTDRLPAAIRAFIDATNAADSDAFAAAFTSDTYLNDWGREFHGRDGVRARTEGLSVPEIAEIFGVHRKTPGNVLLRARQRQIPALPDEE